MRDIKEIIETIRLKNNIKREYFTVVIPIIIAIVFVIGAYMTGHTLYEEKKVEEKDDRQKAYEALLKELAEEEGGEGIILPEESAEEQPQENTTKADLDHYLIYALIIAITPYSIDRFIQRNNKKRNEEDFTQFLFKLSEMMRAGIDPIKSVIELSKTDLGSISPHIMLAASTMVLGGSFEEGMRKVAKAMGSELSSKYIDLVIQASNMGGAVSDLILKASEDMRSMIMIEREMEGNLKQYTVIFYFAQLILIVLAYILSTSLFPYLTGAGTQMVFGGGGIANLDYQQGFFHLIIGNAIIGGVIIGKITQGSAKDGLKHTLILTASCYLICLFLILPTPPAELVTFEVLSGEGQNMMCGLPLKDPIVLKVLDADGKPKAGTFVEFSISPSGKVTPSVAKTNDEGIVSVKAILGEETGAYIIEAKVGESVQKITATGE